MEEVWKDIVGYEGVYQCSTLGMVRSLDRVVKSGTSLSNPKKGKILARRIKKNGYVQVGLCRNQKVRWFNLGRLIYQTFNGKTDLQIDHINDIKTDNRLVNLQPLSQRDNNIKAKRHNKTSKYPGVCWYRGKKWRAQVVINQKKIHLGYFDNEDDAFNAYRKSLPL